MNKEDKAFRDMSNLVTESMELVTKVQANANHAFLRGFYLGVSVAFAVGLIARWYYG